MLLEMPSRKPHKNSHHGCIQCKSKRVKCDQEQPDCARCRKKGRTCVYKHLTSSYDPFKNYRSAESQSISTGSSSVSPVTPNLAFDASNNRLSPRSFSDTTLSPVQVYHLSQAVSLPLLKSPSMTNPVTEQQLLNHYATEVSIIFTSTEAQVEVLSYFHDAVVRHSSQHSYVYHAMLTVSALHLASLALSSSPSSQAYSPHLVTALAHKAFALERLRSNFKSMTAPTCEPALVTSGLLTVSTFALLHVGIGADMIDLLSQIMTLYRGTVAIFRLGREAPTPSPTIPRVRQSVVIAIGGEKPWLGAEEAIDKVLTSILGLSEPTEAAKKRKATLLHAAFELKVALRRAAGARGVYNVACMWLVMVQPAFVEAVKARDPLSLVLLAHWVVGLRYVKGIWWVRGWPERVVEVVWRETKKQYPALLDWVLQEVQSEAE
ncbi:hypothetical protein M426DRAFT_120066 [Hypoxylon sp. CI-4A]|nr:hypothetical protein M426DRAFT_120066 [Hypoxylon sp. CI-4A]